MQRLRDRLLAELTACQVIYGGYGRSHEEMLILADEWAKCLTDCWGFPGDEKVLHEAFLEHKQSRDKFPAPSSIRGWLLEARLKYLRRNKKEALPPNMADERLPGLVARAVGQGFHDRELEELLKKLTG